MQTRLQRYCAAPAFAQVQNNINFLLPAANRSFAASEKQLKMRMKSVTSIRKITKAMKLVAASKMKSDLNRLENGKSYGCSAVDMMFKTDLYMQRRAPELPAVPRTLIVPITSDKGMCGGVNSQLLKQLREFVAHTDRSKVAIFPIGEKGSSGLLRPLPDLIKTSVSHTPFPLNYPTVMAISEHIIAQGEEADQIIVYYNEFKSAISTIIRKMELMPRSRFITTLGFGKLYNQKLPDKNTSNPALYELYVTSNLWVAFLNNAASEQSARMTAMENATKNAGEILEKLTIQYNRARQARITTELVEIISGASALE